MEKVFRVHMHRFVDLALNFTRLIEAFRIPPAAFIYLVTSN